MIRRLDGRGMVLTGTGPIVWEALDRPQTVDELAASLAAEFDRSANEIAADLVEALAALRTNDIVIEVDG